MLEIFSRVRGAVVGRESEIKSILAAMDAGKHILLEGPPGTSKSTLLRNIAREAEIPFFIVEGNIDLTPAKLVGHFNPAKVMSDNYHPDYFEKGPLTRAMIEGGILYIEEFNRMPADVSNVLITPMEEGEMYIPRYGTVHAVRPFTVIAAQNPYDDVGTVRVSRAFMDRICLIKLDYQTEEEERSIVFGKTSYEKGQVIEQAVKIVRRTREHPDIKLGASVRAAIDLVEVYASLQRLEDNPDCNFLTAARMALVNKIWLNEMAARTPEKIIEDIWDSLRVQYKEMVQSSPEHDGAPDKENDVEEVKEIQKKKMIVM